MTPVAELLLVLFTIYLWSCLLWVRRDRVIIARSLFAGWTLRTARTLWGNDRGVLFMQNPFPIWSAVVLSPFPLSISSVGIYSRSPEDYTAGQNRAAARFLAFDDILDIAVFGSELHINGSYFVHTSSAEAADELKGVIERLQHSSAKREDLIKDFVRRALNFNEAHEKLRSDRRRNFTLQVFCTALCIELFVALPVAALRLGSGALLACFAAVIATNLVTLALFYKTHATCRLKNAPLTELAMMFLCFPKTARAFDILKAELTANYHPLTFAAAVDKVLLQDTARLVLAELMFSVQKRNAVEQHFRAAYCETLREQLRRVGIQPEQLLAPPEQENRHSVSYCPLCRNQYRRSGVCADCIEMPLQPFSQAHSASG